MRKKLIYIAIFISQSAQLYSQSWEIVDMHFPPNEGLLKNSKIIFSSKSTGWIVTSGRDSITNIYMTESFKTTDGGQNWALRKKIINYFCDPNLFTLDSNHFWFLGRDGVLIFTKDGGNNWDSTLVQQNKYFGPIYFFDNNNGFSCEEYLWTTQDGGKTWSVDSSKSKIFCPADISFPVSSTGWIVGACSPSGATHSGDIIKTTDYGLTWSHQSDSSILILPSLVGVKFIDSLKGYAIGNNSTGTDGYVFSTLDGGKTWNHKQIISSGSFYDIDFKSDVVGWITGDNGNIWSTTNGGLSWEKELIQDGYRLSSIQFIPDESTVYAFGDNYYLPPFILLKKDIITKAIDGPNLIWEGSHLSQNYPNPFNQSTAIEYQLESNSYIQITVFNTLGEIVDILFTGYSQKGIHKLTWEAKSGQNILPSGVYYIQIESNQFRAIRKMLLLK